VTSAGDWKDRVKDLAARVGLSTFEAEHAIAGVNEPLDGHLILMKEKEQTMAVTADRATEANEYMKKNMLFTPRMFQIINTVAPAAGEKFSDYYATIFGDGALPRKIKELMFVAIGVTWRSPACLIHIIPAIEAGATDGEIFEAVAVATNAAGFVPGGVGIPYAFQYAVKVLEIADKYRKGEAWEYVQPAEFKM
jgi:alkylhydroperoxidase/carboxymuconolactone decarboxylase family protein YurZ